MTRHLASIKRITKLEPIKDADLIELATVDEGWKTVVQKGKFTLGDLAVYFEIDSWVPHSIAPFLSKGKAPRVYNGVEGERLKTIRLKGTLSQGLAIPITDFEFEQWLPWNLGDDVTTELGVQKYEPPIPAQLAGSVEGAFPPFIPKTDQERCQNLHDEIFTGQGRYTTYEVTEKLEGSSMTVYIREGKVGVCSRNWEIKESDSNTFWATAHGCGVVAALRAHGSDVALQGELIGEGIQGNYYGIKGHRFYVFDAHDLTTGKKLLPEDRQELVKTLGLSHVPVIKPTENKLIYDVDDLLAIADGYSEINPKKRREGLVFKSNTSDFSFKAVSNEYLLKNP